MKSLRRQAEPQAHARAHTLAPTPPATDADAPPPSLVDAPRPGPDAFAPPSDSGDAGAARPLAPARWDWTEVRRVLVVRLRSIGDTVLATPSLHALRRFLPDARIDVLLEDWVAPLLEGSAEVDRVVTVRRKSKSSRLRVARALRAENYDVVYNLHGGSTAALIVRATGARRRVGYGDYAYASLHNHTAPPSSALWGRAQTHSAEQQLALLGWTGVPVTDRPATRLAVTHEADARVARRLRDAKLDEGAAFTLVHPAAAFETKTWAAEKFARVVEHLAARGLASVAVAGPGESRVLEEVRAHTRTPLVSFADLTLPELTALAARASLFVGNDSGVAHIAAAVRVPQVVVFGSSNVAHWRPWSPVAAEVVREEMPCAPCPGYTCSEFDAPECIRRVRVEHVTAAVERVLAISRESGV
ncbi:MAG: glycosyltransferase family 9 protein [Acidobacteriota bacterium]|nr:glycosyltransferase family 9 protein [Acidobacteriota bacterium]